MGNNFFVLLISTAFLGCSSSGYWTSSNHYRPKKLILHDSTYISLCPLLKHDVFYVSIIRGARRHPSTGPRLQRYYKNGMFILDYPKRDKEILSNRFLYNFESANTAGYFIVIDSTHIRIEWTTNLNGGQTFTETAYIKQDTIVLLRKGIGPYFWKETPIDTLVVSKILPMN
jgi:hypothetical protein